MVTNEVAPNLSGTQHNGIRFVANGVQLIEAYTSRSQWNYVDTKENPRDSTSRGSSPKETEWVDLHLNGPHFLRSYDTSGRGKQTDIEVLEDDIEVKQE